MKKAILDHIENVGYDQEMVDDLDTVRELLEKHAPALARMQKILTKCLQSNENLCQGTVVAGFDEYFQVIIDDSVSKTFVDLSSVTIARMSTVTFEDIKEFKLTHEIVRNEP